MCLVLIISQKKNNGTEAGALGALSSLLPAGTAMMDFCLFRGGLSLMTHSRAYSRHA